MKNEKVCDAHVEGDECPYCEIESIKAENKSLRISLRDQVKRLKTENGRLQLVAGRYQFMWEAAQVCINKIDDWFEYAVLICTRRDAQKHVQKHLAIYTDVVSKSKSQIGK